MGGWTPAGVVTTPAIPQYDYIGDFNDDGIPDIVSGVFDYSGVLVYAGKGDGTFSDSGVYTPSPMRLINWSSGDLNEDGHLDLLVRADPDWPTPPYVLFGRGDGTFSMGPVLALANQDKATSPGWPHGLYDMNGDGHLDYIRMDEEPGGYVYVALGNGDGTFQPDIFLSAAGPEDGGVYLNVVVGDVNNDGRPDLIANNYFDGDVTIFLNQCR